MVVENFVGIFCGFRLNMSLFTGDWIYMRISMWRTVTPATDCDGSLWNFFLTS